MNAEEMSEFRRFFAAMRPERRVQLDRIGTPNNEAAVPFMYALSAFHKDFVGLKQYVRGFTDELDTDLRAVVIVIALAHLFAGTSIHSSVFAQHLRIPPTAPARLAARFGDKVHGLLLEERPGYWRTTHSLVAKQILLELLTPKEGSGTADPESWRFALPDWAETLIGFVSDAATGELPIDSDELLQQLFIKREVRHDGDKTKYSELIATIPSEARERVFQRLTAEFPEEAHFWAHYSRWQSFEARDHFAARQSMDKALQRDNSDPTLWHMRGTNVRRELYGFLDAHRFQATTPEDRADAQTVVERLAKEAIGDYNEARRIDDRSEYPLISTAELCLRVIEWGKTVYTASSYTQFLNRPSSQFFAELLDIAEDSADAIIELEGDDKESRAVAQVRSRLKGIYDDYNGMIQGWRNILDKSSGSKTAIRVRLAHLYGLRNGGWDTATKADISAAMTLLNESLLDNPTDPRTVRAWLSAGRHSGVSLNRAAEVVSHWVEYINSRDALYYDYVLSALSALNGALSSSEDLSRKVTLMRSRSQDFEQKRTIFDWVGKHEGLGQLINKAQVIEWDRSIAGSDPSALRRLQGRVNTISNPKSGTILLANDVEVFFTPSAAGMLAGQDNNVAVTALVGFSYDGLIAWGVERKA
ncbi:MAG: hypothetical protein H7288_14985 [Kineosporiaceae bacterium]|nr:hypothetical protein [Aeromicrobium sp.]